MQRYCFLLLVFLPASLQGQTLAPEKKTHSVVSLSLGSFLAGIQTNASVRNSYTVGTELDLNYQYFFNNHFGVGVMAEFTKPYTKNQPDDDSTTRLAEATINRGGLSFQYNIIDKPRFHYFIGSTHMGGTFNYYRVGRDSSESTVISKGFQHAISTGFRWYFTKHIGLCGDFRWQLQAYRARSYSVNGVEKEYFDYLPVTDVVFNFRGVSLRLGLTFQF